MSNRKIGVRDLRAGMARKGISQKEVAAALGLSSDYVCKILNDKRVARERRAQIQEYIKTHGGMR
ncbi:MAG: helix-turn-helix transcriptional regulator [Candidatus Cloacimonetes bacterium]|nr:helix-turn-helix transcriptional regulator [Candidatus Cloacimonadota bacterium]